MRPRLHCARLQGGDSGTMVHIDPAGRADFFENVSGLAPDQETTVAVWHDDVRLWVQFQCVDALPWATLTERDAPLFQEEVVEVFLDPFGDGEIYFEIEVNPLNTVMDLVLRKNRSGYVRDFSWQCDGLQTEVHRTTAGWNAVLGIPFLSVSRKVPEIGEQWRVNFTRIDRPGGPAAGPDRELSAWSPTMHGTFHVPECFGVLAFVK